MRLRTSEWELPFASGGPIDPAIDVEGVGGPTLEVEVRLPDRVEDSPSAVT